MLNTAVKVGTLAFSLTLEGSLSLSPPSTRLAVGMVVLLTSAEQLLHALTLTGPFPVLLTQTL